MISSGPAPGTLHLELYNAFPRTCRLSVALASNKAERNIHVPIALLFAMLAKSRYSRTSGRCTSSWPTHERATAEMTTACMRSALVGASLSLRSQAGPSSLRLTTAFSTSAAHNAVGAKKKGSPSSSPKKKIALRKTTPAGGSSKQKKRGGGGGGSSDLFKSSTYAQAAPTMSHLPEFLPELATKDSVYKVMAWSRRTLEATRYQAFGLTKTISRQFADEPRPKTLIRPHTIEILDQLDNARSASSGSHTLIDAPVGFGVSTLILQAFSYALESGWFVLYIPRSLSLVDSSSPYVYSEAHQTYLQPELTRGFLERILAVNADVLQKMTLQEGPIALGGTGKLDKGAKLSDIIREALRPNATPATLHLIFEALMRNVVQQKEVPVLLALDGIQGLFSTSHYRDPDYRPLQSFELGVPRTLLSSLRRTGSGSFGGVQKGAALTAMGLANKTWPCPPELRSALNIKPFVDPYTKMDETIRTIVSECQFDVKDLSRTVLSRQEASALFDTVRTEGGLWVPANDELLMTKLVECGGNLAVFQRSLHNTMI